jgi:hypothetical protein
LGLQEIMIELECRKVRFYSDNDEAAFFSWANSIPRVASVKGRGHSIIVSVKSGNISDLTLRELIALFKRYRIAMKQLAQFKSPQNKSWFAASDAFWFKSVFGAGPTKRSNATRRKRRAV